MAILFYNQPVFTQAEYEQIVRDEGNLTSDNAVHFEAENRAYQAGKMENAPYYCEEIRPANGVSFSTAELREIIGGDYDEATSELGNYPIAIHRTVQGGGMPGWRTAVGGEILPDNWVYYLVRSQSGRIVYGKILFLKESEYE